MMRKHWLAIILMALLSTTILWTYSQTLSSITDKPDVYIGIDAAYDNATLTSLIDQVSPYTNLFIVGSTSITLNQTRLNSTCQYLYDKGLNFIVFQDAPVDIYNPNNLANRTNPLNSTNTPYPQPSQRPNNNYSRYFTEMPVSNWTKTARDQWGSKFLGIYYIDEVAGRQLDQYPGWIVVRNASDYVDAANKFNQSISHSIQWFRSGYADGQDLTLFSSDYALYQFDYNAGYDVIFAQFGWNYSRQLNIALCRGAATVANKDWGAIITWEYNQMPYLESASKLYDDMVLAYNNGAKYITVFDSDQGHTQSVLTADHLQAIKDFWQYVKENPRTQSASRDRVAFVLPQAYGYGFRGPDDSIWGLWSADDFSTNLSIAVGEKLLEYEERLDIVYNQTLLSSVKYGQLFY
jgi:hypothetical protein